MNHRVATPHVIPRARIVYLALVVTVMAVIFWFSARPGEASQDLSNGFLDWLLNGNVPVLSWLANTGIFEWINIRKCAHAFIYFTLGVCTALAAGTWELTPRKLFAYPWLVSVLYACSDELHQYFVPGRSCAFFDVVIDSAGALVGVLCVLLIKRYFRQRT